LRRQQSIPLLNQIKAWLDAEGRLVLPRSPMAAAIGYTLNQWDALKVYTTQGFLTIDNNAAERAMKRAAIGRNYAESRIMQRGASPGGKTDCGPGIRKAWRLGQLSIIMGPFYGRQARKEGSHVGSLLPPSPRNPSPSSESPGRGP
jgi:hypothetical protein